MYKPHTIEQYKVYRFLEENFALEHFLLAPLSRFGLMLEDKTGEKIAFAFLNDCVQEIPVPAPAAPKTVIAFLKQFRSLTPRPVIHDFEALTRWWLDNPNPLTYQQALGMSDILYRHFLSHPLINEDDALRLARKGLVTESEYNDLQLWYFNGHNAHDVYRLTVTHRASPLSFFGVVRFFSYSASLSLAHSGSLL